MFLFCLPEKKVELMISVWLGVLNHNLRNPVKPPNDSTINFNVVYYGPDLKNITTPKIIFTHLPNTFTLALATFVPASFVAVQEYTP